MRGKEKCKALKEIRRKIAEENDIAYAVEECSHKGDCKGTCPKCESELRYLERELERKRRLGEKVAIAGVSVGAMAALTACNPVEDLIIEPMSNVVSSVKDAFGHHEPEMIAGDEVYIEPEMGEPIEPDFIYVDPDDELLGEEVYQPEDDPNYVPEDDETACKNDDGGDDDELAGDVEIMPEDDAEIIELEGDVARPIE